MLLQSAFLQKKIKAHIASKTNTRTYQRLPNVNVPTQLERELQSIDLGIDLAKVTPAEVLGRVSVVTPTASRARFHPQLWQCFLDQTYPDKELVVVETHHGEPSTFFQEIAAKDPRVRYINIQRAEGDDLSIGAKRNLTCLLASGQFIVNFDDDDFYAECYVERMVGEMTSRKLAALTLSRWFNYFESRGIAGYSAPESWDPEDEQDRDGISFTFWGMDIARKVCLGTKSGICL